MKRFLVAIFAILCTLVLVIAVAYSHRSDPTAVLQYETTNPLIHTPTQISAHRCGGGDMPEETMMAFKNCIESDEFDVDMFEFDLHLTADGTLVLLHDEDLDRTSDSAEVFGEEGVKVQDKTYEELRQLNMGAKFMTANGDMPYAGLSGDDVPDDLRILALNDALDYLEANGTFGYIIEIKPGGELGRRALDALYAALKERGIVERVAFGTFQDDVAQYAEERYPDLARGASPSEVVDFYIAALTGRSPYEPTFEVLQLPFALPEESHYLNLGTAQVVNYAHAHDLAVQYWTVNNPEDIRYLMSIDADAVMTDYPEVAYRVRAEMQA